MALKTRERWPGLPFDGWSDTLHLVHMWTQIVGKIRLVNTPLVNHWWNSTLVVTPRGLTTGAVPSGDDAFQIDFDFIGHELTIVTNRGGRGAIPLRSMSVAGFYREVLDLMARLGLAEPRISPTPNEVAIAVPFPEDLDVRPYDRDRVEAFAAILLNTYFVFEGFRASFLGKASPVQFFWGGFDLASARFSGKRGPSYGGGTPPHINAHVMHEAYSHELIAAGFWPGSGDVPQPQPEYYAYAMPALDGLPAARIRPVAAGWSVERGEFILPYEAVRTSPDPAASLLEFLQSTYDSAADLGHWDRPLLEEQVLCDCDPVPFAMRRRPRSSSERLEQHEVQDDQQTAGARDGKNPRVEAG
jgi:hypothetical protein